MSLLEFLMVFIQVTESGLCKVSSFLNDSSSLFGKKKVDKVLYNKNIKI